MMLSSCLINLSLIGITASLYARAGIKILFMASTVCLTEKHLLYNGIKYLSKFDFSVFSCNSQFKLMLINVPK